MKFFVKLVAVVLLGISAACEGLESLEIKPVDKNDVENTTDTLDVPKEEVETPITTHYTIKKGNHYPTKNYFASCEIEELKFKAKFDSTAIYETEIPGNQADINKLYGFSDCNDFHHKNSARFGWRWYNDQLEILGYVYANGDRKWKLIGPVELNSYNVYSIKAEEDEYIFMLNETSVELPRHCTEEKASGYILYPYFGGDESAPREINIFIEEL